MEKNFELRFNRDNVWRMEHFHFHENFELLLSLTDGESFFVRNKLYPLRRGTLLLLGNAELHRSTAGGERTYERYVLHFSPEYVSSLSTMQSNLISFLQASPRYRQLSEEELSQLVKLLEACRRPVIHFGDDIRLKAAFTEVLLTICELFGAQESSTPLQSSDFVRVAPVIDYIQKSLAEPLSLELLAEKFFISKHYLCHLFKQATGFGVAEYIIHCRVLHARSLLRQGKSVQEAGEESGFHNNAHFIRTFHKLVGVPPGRYGREYKHFC